MGGRRERVLERTQIVPTGLERTFAFFANARNLEAITPPWLHFRILAAPAGLDAGALLAYRLRLAGVPIRWLTEITSWRPPRTFTDLQLRGPYRFWEHTHRLRAVPEGTEIYDHVRYQLPFEPAASLLAPFSVEPALTAIFDFRHDAVARLLT